MNFHTNHQPIDLSIAVKDVAAGFRVEGIPINFALRAIRIMDFDTAFRIRTIHDWHLAERKGQ